MEFIRIASMAEGAQPLYERLRRELEAGEQVLWLVPGGSNIPLTVEVMLRLPDDLTSRLTVMLTDERYGEVDHLDSNTRQLREAGFTPAKATVIPVLQAAMSLNETVEHYKSELSAAFAHASVVIGQFGMGPDGHIAGILPGSPAVISSSLVAGYQAEKFTRITMTPPAFQHVDTAYVYAFGDAKRQALENLSKNISLDEQPAQIVKSLPEAYVYNDQFGDSQGETV